VQDKKLAEEEEDLEAKMAQVTCSLNNREDCLACGS
jgi:ribonucleoside-diphosphate reductase subunit M1